MKKYQSLPFPFHLQSLYLQSYSFVLCLGDRADLSFPFSLLSPNPLLTATLSKNQFVEMARKLIRKKTPCPTVNLNYAAPPNHSTYSNRPDELQTR